nr:MAG TPA: hypothetical protein [Caudoviricetes sp.]
MFIEYMNYSLGKTPTSIMTEDVYNDPDLTLKLNVEYAVVVAFIKTQLAALLHENYSIEINRISDAEYSRKILDQIAEEESFDFAFRSVHLKGKALCGEIKMNGTFVTKFEIDNAYLYSEMFTNMLNSRKGIDFSCEDSKSSGTVVVSGNKKVEGTTLNIGNTNEFMKTMNAKFTRRISHDE